MIPDSIAVASFWVSGYEVCSETQTAPEIVIRKSHLVTVATLSEHGLANFPKMLLPICVKMSSRRIDCPKSNHNHLRAKWLAFCFFKVEKTAINQMNRNTPPYRS